MRVLSLNVGRPREVEWRGDVVRTSIFKTPVDGPRVVRRLNVAGDEQSDLRVHGGALKAVYAYPSEHYEFWRGELADRHSDPRSSRGEQSGVAGRETSSHGLSWASFGENLTTEGLLEEETFVGDRFRVGGAELVVTQPRFPCYKLGVRFGRADMVKRFHKAGRSGIYFSVAAEGPVQAGDAIERLEADARGLTIADFVRLFTGEIAEPARLEAAANHSGVPESWRRWFAERVSAGSGG